MFLVLGLEHSCPWPRKGLSSERLTLALAWDFFMSLASSLVSSTPPPITAIRYFVSCYQISSVDKETEVIALLTSQLKRRIRKYHIFNTSETVFFTGMDSNRRVDRNWQWGGGAVFGTPEARGSRGVAPSAQKICIFLQK